MYRPRELTPFELSLLYAVFDHPLLITQPAQIQLPKDSLPVHVIQNGLDSLIEVLIDAGTKGLRHALSVIYFALRAKWVLEYCRLHGRTNDKWPPESVLGKYCPLCKNMRRGPETDMEYARIVLCGGADLATQEKTDLRLDLEQRRTLVVLIEDRIMRGTAAMEDFGYLRTLVRQPKKTAPPPADTPTMVGTPTVPVESGFERIEQRLSRVESAMQMLHDKLDQLLPDPPCVHLFKAGPFGSFCVNCGVREVERESV
jgi:hypothetical protein